MKKAETENKIKLEDMARNLEYEQKQAENS